MPVTLPPVTMSRFESSPMRRPAGLRSSCAIRSKRGSVQSKSCRNSARTEASIRLVQVSSRSHRRSASWSAPEARDSRSIGVVTASFTPSPLRPTL